MNKTKRYNSPEICEVANISDYAPNKNDDSKDQSIYSQKSMGELLDFSKTTVFKSRFEKIARDAGISESLISSFSDDVLKIIESYNKKSLPERPNREYRRGEDVIEYIRSDDGLGPWVNANLLNRPLIRHLAPEAYFGLMNYLRRHDLPSDLNIPKKSEVLASEKIDISPDAVKAARRLLSLAQRDRQSGREMS